MKKEKKIQWGNYWQVSPNNLIEIEVDTYIKKLGGFMKAIKICIPNSLANDLMGKVDSERNRYRDKNYWKAIATIRKVIAEGAGIRIETANDFSDLTQCIGFGKMTDCIIVGVKKVKK